MIKPTPTQCGGFLGTLLTIIGVPLLVKALTGGTLQHRTSVVSHYRVPPIIVPKQPTPRVVSKQSGTGMQNRPARSKMMVPYQPPQIWTNPEDF